MKIATIPKIVWRSLQIERGKKIALTLKTIFIFASYDYKIEFMNL